MRINTVFRKLLGVTGLVVEGVEFLEDGLTIEVRPRAQRPRCGRCGRRAPGYDRRAPRRWRHLGLGKSKLWLRYAPRRVECERCGVVNERVPWAEQGSRFTRDFEELVAYLAQGTDQTRVRELMGISWSTVGEIVARVVKRCLDPDRLKDLRRIGIDEFSYRRRHRFVTTVVDHDRRRIVWAAPGKNSDTLFAFFDALGLERCDAIEVITVDFAMAWKSAIEICAPNAKVIYDRFHVQRLASDAVDQVRREQLQALRGTSEGDQLFGARFALLKRAWDLRQPERETLGKLARHNLPLYRGYLLKEALANALDRRDPRTAERALKNWLAWATRSRLAPFQRVARTIRKHFDGILAYVRERLTNGIVEGFNTRLRMIARRAFGFHSARPLISMLFLCCGGIHLKPPLPSPT